VGVAVEGCRGTEVCPGWAGVGLIFGFWGFWRILAGFVFIIFNLMREFVLIIVVR
jgi:hypothetical protein